MSEVFLRRLTPSLVPFVQPRLDFRVVSIHRPIQELQALLRYLSPDGIVTECLPQATEAILDLGLPTVIADTDAVYHGSVSVDVDDWAVGAEAAKAFLRGGYRHFACLGNGTPYSQQRVEGFRRTLGASVTVRDEAEFTLERYSEQFAAPGPGFQEWLHALPKPVGIFAVHDPLGRFLCARCRELGVDVPNQAAIIGANNDELVCRLSFPMLSSVVIPWDQIGGMVGGFMVDLLAGKQPAPGPHRVAPGGVVLRHSANHLAVEDPELRRAMSYVSEHLQDPFTVAQMCRQLRLSRRGIERKFKDYFNCTPWQMICRMRVNRAKALLSETNHPISKISELCGMNDPERLAVVFKRATGMSPSWFRRRL